MNNMNSQTLKKLPPPADRQGEDATLHQSTTVKTSSSDIPFVPMPDSPLPKPASTEEQIQQAALSERGVRSKARKVRQPLML